MNKANLILRRKLTPPHRQHRVLQRPRLTAQLLQALEHRLTILHAGTGYSKTTSLASLVSLASMAPAPAPGQTPLFWYSLDEEDADPQRFLLHLDAAFRLHLPHLSDLSQAILQERGAERGPQVWTQTLDALINALDESLTEPSLLVLDDYHSAPPSSPITSLLEHFLTYLPANLHVVISTRYPYGSPSLPRWKAHGEVLEIGREQLAFRPEEIETLFRDTYGIDLSTQEVTSLAERSEGWPIALQLVWQGLRSGAGKDVGTLLKSNSEVRFDYLASEVLASQSEQVKSFLYDTAVLRELTPASCDAVRRASDSLSLLSHLHSLDLFIVALDDRHSYRYHYLFHDFLRRRLEADGERAGELHRRAALYFQGASRHEEAIRHWLSACDYNEAAAAIEKAGEAALQAGLLSTVAGWIDTLPPEVLAGRPLLQAYLGDVYRLQSRFDEALAWYSQAEATWRTRNDPAGIGRALRGQALIYLDTVRPAQAERYLEEALRLYDGVADLQARARLLELLAENKLNMGKPDEAGRLRDEARALREEGPAEDVLSVRVKLRTGRLDEAQRTLESWAEQERGQIHPPRAHRETSLILSLISSFRGEAGRALALAEEGIQLGERSGSPFVTAVGYMRVGHALQLQGERQAVDEAITRYQAAISIGDTLAVKRTHAEALWGLTRAYGYSGDLHSAERCATEGTGTAGAAGDAWMIALIELALGASYLLASRPTDAAEVLSRVLAAFRDCGDNFGRASARLWQCLAYLDLRQGELFASAATDLLELCETQKYDFLLTRPTLLGPPDPRRIVPALIEARNRRIRHTYVAHLLLQSGLAGIQVHPGYRLRVQTLGAFRVWRGDLEIQPREWQRDKARQLFQLLITQHGRALQREAIVERLWPDLSPEAAERDFKVALSALNKTIEPARPPEAPFAFIVRDGKSYGIRPDADICIDAATFEHECHAGVAELAISGTPGKGINRLIAALEMYAGSYLPDALYEDWASAERERLLSLYLRTADRLADALNESGRYEEALDVCERILAYDPCWERAYRTMMLAHAHRGNRPLALRTFQRCAAVMSAELGVEPSPATAELLHTVMAGDKR